MRKNNLCSRKNYILKLAWSVFQIPLVSCPGGHLEFRLQATGTLDHFPPGSDTSLHSAYRSQRNTSPYSAYRSLGLPPIFRRRSVATIVCFPPTSRAGRRCKWDSGQYSADKMAGHLPKLPEYCQFPSVRLDLSLFRLHAARSRPTV